MKENEAVTLNCSAEGMPTPSITWTRVSDNSPVSFPLTIAGKQDEGGYRCTADNGIGNPASQVVYVIVESELMFFLNFPIKIKIDVYIISVALRKFNFSALLILSAYLLQYNSDENCKVFKDKECF